MQKRLGRNKRRVLGTIRPSRPTSKTCELVFVATQNSQGALPKVDEASSRLLSLLSIILYIAHVCFYVCTMYNTDRSSAAAIIVTDYRETSYSSICSVGSAEFFLREEESTSDIRLHKRDRIGTGLASYCAWREPRYPGYNHEPTLLQHNYIVSAYLSSPLKTWIGLAQQLLPTPYTCARHHCGHVKWSNTEVLYSIPYVHSRRHQSGSELVYRENAN